MQRISSYTKASNEITTDAPTICEFILRMYHAKINHVLSMWAGVSTPKFAAFPM